MPQNMNSHFLSKDQKEWGENCAAPLVTVMVSKVLQNYSMMFTGGEKSVDFSCQMNVGVRM